jgi:catechol 2,3-dioxygenase-like lactoylglutathione lyase family enzyme
MMVIPDVGLGRIGQVGIVVRDIKASMEHYWRALGIGPWKVYTNGAPPLRNVTYYGAPASYRVRVALAHTESMVFELIQYLEGDSIHRDFLATHGEGVEHMGVYVSNLDEPLARLRSQGLTVLQSADGLGAIGDGRYVYLDTRSTLGTVLELIQAPSQRVMPELTYP